MKHIKKFNEDVYDDVSNYIISYTKDSTKTDVDMSVGATDLKDLVNRVEGTLSKNEFISIYKIEIGFLDLR